jgi:tetratricopeptide (TPR) repeat protein
MPAVAPPDARAPSDDIEVERMYAKVRGGLFGRRPEPVRLGRYEVLERIGAGGMGMVYAGRDTQLGRKVAIKLLRPGREAGIARAQARLLREAKAMARVSSPFAVTVFEAGTHGQQVFVAMEFVEGQTLTQWLGAEPRTWRAVVEVFVQAAQGLAAVHEAGLVHRDFKPDNVLLGQAGAGQVPQARVADFGLAAAVDLDADAGEDGPPLETGSAVDLRLTFTGFAVGSLAYMSPEQHRREAVDARSDQFAFCVALYEALVGHRPFGADTADALRRDVLRGDVDWRSASSLPDRVLRLLRRGLSLDPAARFDSMTAVQRELERALHPSRRWWWVGAGALLATSVASASFAFGRDDGPCAHALVVAAAAWNAERRVEVADALRGTERPFADRTAKQVEERLDAHAAAWSAAFAQTCDADEEAESRNESLMTIACLDRSAVETRALTRAFVDDPHRLVEHATLAVYKLRDPSRCVDEPAQAGAGAGSDPDAVVGRTPIFAALADAEARLHAADFDQGREQADVAIALARDLGEPALEAEALLLRGMLHSGAGAWADAERDLFAANEVAERLGAWPLVVQARTELVFVVGYRQQRYGEAAVWSNLSESALDRAGRGGLVEVRLLNARGLVEHAQDRVPEAATELERALALAREHLGPDHPGLAATLENLARVELARERPQDAARRAKEAYDIRVRTLGPGHPDTVRARTLSDAAAATP